MALELRFPDPAFTCEVVLSGPAKALYEAAWQHFERLKSIKSLGIASHVSEIAFHTRHHHLIGLMRIFNKLCEQPRGKGLPKQFLWSFWCRLCFGQTGHATFSYDSEKAVLLACHVEPSFNEKFRALLQPVIDRIAACSVCGKQCEARTKDAGAAALWFNDLVQMNRWPRVHLWVAALKMVQEPTVLSILRQQVVCPENAIGFSEPEALKMLVSPECQWRLAFARLSRLDYVVRDLAFAGTLGIQVDVDGLVAAADEEQPGWRLLKSLSGYLSETLYENIEAQTASILFQRALAAQLISGKVSLEKLFGIDPDSALGDDTLAKLLERTKSGREAFDRELRTAWRTWPINTYVDKTRVPSEIEKLITGQPKLHLFGHTRTRVTCLRLRQDHSLGLAMCHRDQASRPAAKAFVKLCRSILLKQCPRLVPGDLTTALYEGLVDRACEHGLEGAVKRCAEISLPQGILQGAAEVVNRRASVGAPGLDDISFRVGGFDYPFRGDLQGLQINVMHAAIRGNDTVRDNLGITLSGAAAILWSQVLNWQSVYFGQRPLRKILRLVEEAQNLLARSAINSEPTAENDLELYTLLEALKHPAQSVSFRIALPNLKLLKDDKTTENEYDVVSVILKEDKHVEVWIWGVTTETDIRRKRGADHQKIQRLIDHLGTRWGNEVRTVKNYVHKDGNEICCDIDGRQERRPLAP